MKLCYTGDLIHDPHVLAIFREEKSEKHIVHVPRGTSTYQMAWIMHDQESSSSEEMDFIDTDMEFDATESKASSFYESEEMDVQSQLYQNVEDEDNMKIYDEIISEENSVRFSDKLEEEDDINSRQKYYLKKKRDERDDLEFPDEVHVPTEIPARIRFQKYRGLQNFLHSPWDPYENLPPEYAKIFQFQNFSRSRKRILSSVHGVREGVYATVYVKDVPRSHEEAVRKLEFFFALLPYEQKISILNFVIRKHSSFIDPVRSKVCIKIKSIDRSLGQYLKYKVFS
jgi:pre-rRNA-processing protein TSR1